MKLLLLTSTILLTSTSICNKLKISNTLIASMKPSSTSQGMITTTRWCRGTLRVSRMRQTTAATRISTRAALILRQLVLLSIFLHLPPMQTRGSRFKRDTFRDSLRNRNISWEESRNWLIWTPSIVIRTLKLMQASNLLLSTTGIKTLFQKLNLWISLNQLHIIQPHIVSLKNIVSTTKVPRL